MQHCAYQRSMHGKGVVNNYKVPETMTHMQNREFGDSATASAKIKKACFVTLGFLLSSCQVKVRITILKDKLLF